MIPILYIFEASSIPEEYNNSESIILLDKGFEGRDDETPISIDEIHFMSTIAVLSSRPESVLNAFVSWWNDRCECEIKFQKITSELAQIPDFRAEELKGLEEDGWVIKANFVAYCASSIEARDEAIEIIRESEINVH